MERQTKQKGIIYEALQTLDHPTATEVYGYVNERYPTISRATVFRVLGGFAANGRALELKVAGSDVRYDYNVTPHYHVHCKNCGKVADVWTERFSAIGKEIGKEVEGFSIESFSVEFFGVCPACKEESLRS